MKLDREINTLLLTGMYVNLGVLTDQKHRLNEIGQMNLEMLIEDFNRLVEKLKDGVTLQTTTFVVMGYDHAGFGTLFGAYDSGEKADTAMFPKSPRQKPKGVCTEGMNLVSHEVPVNAPLSEYLVYPRRPITIKD